MTSLFGYRGVLRKTRVEEDVIEFFSLMTSNT